jgi:hypothetical protein
LGKYAQGPPSFNDFGIFQTGYTVNLDGTMDQKEDHFDNMFNNASIALGGAGGGLIDLD